MAAAEWRWHENNSAQVAVLNAWNQILQRSGSEASTETCTNSGAAANALSSTARPNALPDAEIAALLRTELFGDEQDFESFGGLTPARFDKSVADAVAMVRPVVAPRDRITSCSSGDAVVLILVGLPASGKSFLAQQLVGLGKGRWARVNQDEMKSRKSCESSARRALAVGQNLVVDRLNFNIQQRSGWMQLASACDVRAIRCLYLDIPVEVCKERIRRRSGHPTIKESAKGEQLIDLFSRLLVPPCEAEGFSQIGHITHENEVEAMISRLLAESTLENADLPDRTANV